jgi:hypothetical protein
MGGGIAQTELRTFQLVTNYRSHGGIVRCASAVIDLITHFWPYAIDSLAPEQGLVDGAKPVFFSGWDTNTVRYVSAFAFLREGRLTPRCPGTILV